MTPVLIEWAVVFFSLLCGTFQELESEEGAPAGAIQTDWTAWRGPGNAGSAPHASPPTSWSSDKNIRWKSRVPGRGAATPIVLGDRVFLLTAIETDEERTPAPQKELRQKKKDDAPAPAPPKFVHDFVVLCYSRQDGSLQWQTKVNSALPHEGHHRHGSYAAGSAVTDGKRVYAFFNSFGLYALDLAGQVLWDRDFGDMTFDRGEGASAALFGDTLVVPWDHRGPSFVIAVDTATGDEKWRTARNEGAQRSTPVIAEVNGRAQVILYGRTARGYDLKTGEELWQCETQASGAVASPIVAGGMVFLYASSQKSKFFGALDLTVAQGDCTSLLAWQHQREVPHVASPAHFQGILYALKANDGILSAFDARTGSRHFGPQRLGLGTIYSSLVVGGDRLYITDRDGQTLILRHGTDYQEIGRNELGEEVASSMALAGDAIFLRGSEHLFCIAND